MMEYKKNITVPKNSHTNIMECFSSEEACERNVLIDIQVEEGASIDYYHVQNEHEKTTHTSRVHITLQKNSKIKAFTLSKGSQLARNDLTVIFKGEHASCELYELYMPKNRQQLEHYTVIDHAVPHCKSYEMYRGILADKSKAVFNGKVIVRPNAFKTEASQSNHNLLLSSDAEIITKPELEIYHDDIKCMHGATIGQLDESALFYLRTRGLDEKSARELLVQGFANKILNFITDDAIREKLCLT